MGSLDVIVKGRREVNDEVFRNRLLFIEYTPYDHMNVLITSEFVRNNQQETKNRRTCGDIFLVLHTLLRYRAETPFVFHYIG